MRPYWLILAACAWGCAAKRPPLGAALPPVGAGEVVANDPLSPTPLHLSNGVVGIALGPTGHPARDEATGEALPMWLAGSFRTDGVSRLRPWPNPLDVRLELPGHSLEPYSGYLERLDLENGLWEAAWRTRSQAKVEVQTILAPNSAVVVQRWRIDPVPAEAFAVELPGLVAARAAADPLSFSCQMPGGPVVTVLERVSGARGLSLRLGQGPARLQGFLAGGEFLYEVSLSLPASKPVSKLSSATVDGLTVSKRLPCRISIEGPVEDQRAVSSMLFHLTSGVTAAGPVGPFGLTNAKYGGRQFWDADTWMFPALAVLAPDKAQAIARFRLGAQGEAARLAQEWAQERPPGSKPLGDALQYPWESGPDGKENAPPESRKEHHVTADVALMLRQADALGLVPHDEASAAVARCGAWLHARSSLLPNGERGILDTMSPDEFHTGDNDLYTNVMAERLLHPPSRHFYERFKRPRDGVTFLSYDGDRLRGYKQAAALLAIWPAQDPWCEREAAQMLDRFAGKTTPSGPAMSRSVEALVRARFGDPDRAYKEWRESWIPYTKGRLMMFSEAPNGKSAYFLTGAAGCLDALIFGFLGLRFDDYHPGPSAWQRQLKGGWWLSCRPRLPSAWKSVSIGPVRVLGEDLFLTAKGKQVTVTRRSFPARRG